MKIPYSVRIASALAREDNPLRAALWLLFTRLKIKRLLRVRIGGERLYVRTATPDVDVALSSLRGEFDELFALTPEPRGGLIVDAGGYIGTAAMAFARRYPEARVVTVEPSSENYAVLLRNVAAFPNVTPVNAALAAQTGPARLQRRRPWGECGFTIVEAPKDGRAGAVVEEVACVTMAELLRRFEAGGADIVKLDIEGGERAILSGDVDWLQDTRALCVELHDRVVGGCTEAFHAASRGRREVKMTGEKWLSLREA